MADPLFWGMLAGMMVILLINGLFVAAEFALVAMRNSRIQELLDEGHPQAPLLKKLKDNLDLSVSGMQLGITLASIALGWIGEDSIHHLVTELFGFIPGLTGVEPPAGIGFVVSFLILGILHVVIGEQVPKVIALRLPERVIMLLARPYEIYSWVMYPLIWFMNKLTNWSLLIIGMKPSTHEEQVHSAEELEILIEASAEAGELEERESDLLKRVLELRELTLADVMISVEQMDTAEVGIGLQGLLKLVIKKKHSKIPVYEGSIDQVVGVLNTPDLFEWWLSAPATGKDGSKDPSKAFDLRKLMRPAYQAQVTDKASAVLDELRRRKIQIAIVKSADGKTLGMVTMEDLLEELVGEIKDEYDH